MTTFSGIQAAGNVTVTEVEVDIGKEYEFEYTMFDAGTGAELAEKRIEVLREEDLTNEKTMLENQRDGDVVRYNNEIAEIVDKLAAIDEAKT